MSTLPSALQDREMQKFESVSDGATRVRTSAVGTFSPQGLQVGGRVTEVMINDVTWTALPGTALTARNAISIQNVSGFEMKVNYDPGVGYIGMLLPNTNERYYDIKDNIVIYGRAVSGAGSVMVTIEEIA